MCDINRTVYNNIIRCFMNYSSEIKNKRAYYLILEQALRVKRDESIVPSNKEIEKLREMLVIMVPDSMVKARQGLVRRTVTKQRTVEAKVDNRKAYFDIIKLFIKYFDSIKSVERLTVIFKQAREVKASKTFIPSDKMVEHLRELLIKMVPETALKGQKI
jgi:hypothetical protein